MFAKFMVGQIIILISSKSTNTLTSWINWNSVRQNWLNKRKGAYSCGRDMNSSHSNEIARVKKRKRKGGKLTADFDLERPRLGVAHVVVGGPTLDSLAVQISVKLRRSLCLSLRKNHVPGGQMPNAKYCTWWPSCLWACWWPCRPTRNNKSRPPSARQSTMSPWAGGDLETSQEGEQNKTHQNGNYLNPLWHPPAANLPSIQTRGVIIPSPDPVPELILGTFWHFRIVIPIQIHFLFDPTQIWNQFH